MNANNIFTINGNLTKAPTLRQSANGKSYCYLDIAVNSGYGKDEEPDYLSVTVWGKQAENACKYLVKGQSVSACGSISSYLDKDKSPRMNLNAQDVQYGRKPITKDKEPVTEKNTKQQAAIEPDPIEPPDTFFAEEDEEPEI